MKKLSVFALVIAFLFLQACTPAQSVAHALAGSLVELPSPIQLFILSLSTLVVGFVFTRIAEALPFLKDFLGQYVDEVSTAVAGAVVLSIQSWLNAIPAEWEGVASAALALVVAILAAYGAIKGAKHVAYTIRVRRMTQR